MERFWVWLHVVGAFGFVMAHGSSAAVALKLRKERDPARIAALLELSSSTLGVMYGSFLVLLASGIVSGFQQDRWGEGWIWTAIGVVVVLFGAMYGLANTWTDGVRRAVGVQTYAEKKKKVEPAGPGTPEEIAAAVSSNRPFVVLAVGAGGLLVILWLMVVKPF